MHSTHDGLFAIPHPKWWHRPLSFMIVVIISPVLLVMWLGALINDRRDRRNRGKTR